MTEKQFKILAIVATGASILMYVTYIFQIQANLAGHKGNPVQPFCAAINCTLWAISIANLPGVILGLATSITAL